MKEMYPTHLFDHYKNPRHRGTISGATFLSEIRNPSCGDRIQVSGIIADGLVVAIAFQGAGCILSQAAASIFAEHILHKSVGQILAMTDDQMQQLVGMEVGPVRRKCMLLVRDAAFDVLSG